ncbi:major facilitator transporter [Streptococcus equinus ATCC 33317]|uniref:MFS transporter n=1 Tax=Streptococcus equinus TaxID=1335 RepID=UPI00050869A4|nr:MFS transporter [Streptococcus equinus]KFN85871.1 major facilitator transporter [Streptococcus equinus ATCC 33317]
MKPVKDRLSFKISLLSISLFLMIAPQISAALPLMYDAFPGASQSGVETLVTVPNFGIMVGLFISPFLIRILGQKSTVLAGLVITLLAGTFPMYATTFTPILISRFLLGAGIGLFNSLAVSLIPQFYDDNEKERATILGFQNVMSSIGAAISSFLVGYLVTISWHAAFVIYFLVIPALILFTLFVPLKKESRQAVQNDSTQKQSVNGKVILIAVLMFFIFMFYLPMSYKLPNMIIENGIGTSSTAAMVAGFSTLVGIPIGASFGFFFKKLRDKIFPIGFLLVTLGFFLTAISHNLFTLLLSMVISGIGFGFAVPYMYNWLGWAAPQNSVNLATTIVLVMVNVGCFLSPSIMGLLSNFLGTAASNTLLISAIGFAFITIYAVAHYVRVHKLHVSNVKEEKI